MRTVLLILGLVYLSGVPIAVPAMADSRITFAMAIREMPRPDRTCQSNSRDGSGRVLGIREVNINGGRGVEVTVLRDDGQQVKVNQPDDGVLGIGDRVLLVYEGNVLQAVRPYQRRP